MNRITNEQREAIVRKAIADRDAALTPSDVAPQAAPESKSDKANLTSAVPSGDLQTALPEDAREQTFVLPTKPLTIIDAINRRCLATGDWRNAFAGSDADYNGHNVEVRWNAHRGYWVASYTWSGPRVIARGELGPCLTAAAEFYAGQGRGASVSVKVESEADAYICRACGYVTAESEDTSWRDWKFEEINFALEMERRGFGPYTHNLIVAASHDEFKRLCRAERPTGPIAALVAKATDSTASISKETAA